MIQKETTDSASDNGSLPSSQFIIRLCSTLQSLWPRHSTVGSLGSDLE